MGFMSSTLSAASSKLFPRFDGGFRRVGFLLRRPGNNNAGMRSAAIANAAPGLRHFICVLYLRG
jgi:hypothetical protein